MLFNSYVFILLFLPITLLGYFMFNKYIPKYGNTIAKIWLLLASLYFYSYFNRLYLLIILVSIAINYALSSIMIKSDNAVLRNITFAVGLSGNIGCLFFYKYYDFFASNVNAVFGTSFTLLHLVLPLGISFFTFQQLSYVIDSYKKKVPQYNFLDYSLFVTFFPQLIAGPIVLHDEIVPQFAKKENQRFNYNNFGKGLFAFSIGLAKKVLLADNFGVIVDWGYTSIGELGTVNALIVVLAYALQLYLDFSAYSDMAIGLGYMFNIELPLNFNSPYKSITLVDFWKRWHMTLYRFLMTYIYFPLGGSRKGTVRTYLNALIVFVVSGIWHGADWTFFIWGAIQGIAVCACKLLKVKKSQNRAINVLLWTFTFAFMCFTHIFVRSNNMLEVMQFFTQIGTFKGFEVHHTIVSTFQLPEFLFILKKIPVIGNYLIISLTAIAFVLCLVGVLCFKNTRQLTDEFNEPKWYHAVLSSVLLVWSILSFAGVSTFLYWNF